MRNITESLKLNNTISHLNLSTNNIGCNYESIQCLCEALKINSSISNLNLADNHIGDSSITCLCEMIKINKSLTKLNLRYNCINSNYHLLEITQALKNNNSIMELNLFGNSIDESLGSIAIKHFTDLFSINTSIVFIGIFHSNTQVNPFIERNKGYLTKKKSGYISILSILARL